MAARAWLGDRPFASRTVVWSVFGLGLVAAPLLFTSSLGLTLLTQMGIAIVACLSYNILFGQGGMLGFGHAVYSGLGAYLAMHTLNAAGAGELAFPVSLVPLVGGVGGMLVAALLGWLITRQSGTTFAMITLGVGELVWATALMFPGFFGGEGGISGNRVMGTRPLGISFGPQIQLYYLIAAYTFVCTALMFAFTGTPLGRMLNAVRDNPERVAFMGFDPRMVRYLAFVVAGFFAGISGGLAALNFEIVTTDVVSANRSAAYLLFTFLGGSTFFFGPIVGALLMVLAFNLLSGWTQAWLLYLGCAFLLMVMYAPGGVAGLMVAHWRWLFSGRLRSLWRPYLAVLVAGAAAFAGIAALVEMVYHLQFDAATGPALRFMGLSINTESSAAWIGAAVLALCGAAACTIAGRRLSQTLARARPKDDEHRDVRLEDVE